MTLPIRHVDLVLKLVSCTFLDAAFALGGEDGHLTVSLDKLRHLSVSGSSATIGGGNHLGDVALYLWEHGTYLESANPGSVYINA